MEKEDDRRLLTCCLFDLWILFLVYFRDDLNIIVKSKRKEKEHLCVMTARNQLINIENTFGHLLLIFLFFFDSVCFDLD